MGVEAAGPEDQGNLFKFFPKVEYVETLLLHDQLFFKDAATYAHEVNVSYHSDTGIKPVRGLSVCCFSWTDTVLYDNTMWNSRADAGRGTCVIFQDIPFTAAPGSAFDMLSHSMTHQVFVTLAGYEPKEKLDSFKDALRRQAPTSPPPGSIALPLEPDELEYESEYRLFFRGSKYPDGEYLSFRPAIYLRPKAVVFGYNMAISDKQRIRNAAVVAGKLTVRFYDIDVNLKARAAGIAGLPAQGGE